MFRYLSHHFEQRSLNAGKYIRKNGNFKVLNGNMLIPYAILRVILQLTKLFYSFSFSLSCIHMQQISIPSIGIKNKSMHRFSGNKRQY